MPHLDNDDWIKINDLVLLINEIEDESEMQKQFLSSLRSLIAFDKGEFLISNKKTNDKIFEKSVSLDIEKENTDKYINYYENVDYARWIFESAVPTVYRDTDIIKDNMRIKTEFFNDYLKPMGVYFPAGVSIVHDGMLLGIIGLFKTRGRGDFSEKDLFILKMFYKHLENRFKKDCRTRKCNNIVFDNSCFESFNITERESQIIKLVLNGLTNEQISENLFISLYTVKTHLKNIFRKTGVKSRSQLFKVMLMTGVGRFESYKA